MIIPNGSIRFKHKTAGGIDPETGKPRKSTSTWGEPIECQYSAVSYNQLAEALGNPITAQSYTILVDIDTAIVSEQIKLTDETTGEVGEFSIKQAKPLNAVGQIQIYV